MWKQKAAFHHFKQEPEGEEKKKRSNQIISIMVRGFTAMFANLGSFLATVMFLDAMFRRYMPQRLTRFLDKYFHSLMRFFYPYIQIKFNEYTGERLTRSEVYGPIKHYLISNTSMQATRLQADTVHQSFVLSMDDNEEVTDEFRGVKFKWSSRKNIAKVQPLHSHPAADHEKRYYQLTFHKKHRDLVIGEYLNHVVKEGKKIRAKNRQRKLYTNNGSTWNHVVFKHPARFETLAMEPEKKQEIIDDLVTFSKSKEYYADIGRSWKRGYLLYGPPGTGKSTMIAAMANLLGYDLYDLELTAVKDNTELKKLLIETSSKSIILIEDIDCSIDLTGQRKKNKTEAAAEEEEKVKVQKTKGEKDTKTSMVTLSGLLNFIDGLWSSCKGERLIVFTTNHVEKLDPALVRSGRMDKHIELSYCGFHSFKVLVKNYLKLESHELFTTIGRLLEETNMTPADVAEHLMPKSFPPNAEVCLQSLINALEMSKEKAKMKSAEEVKKESSTEE